MKRPIISSETDEVRAKREPSLCNESVKRYFWFFSYTAAIEAQIGDNTKRAPTAPVSSLSFTT